ncbi:YegS/Rv2252/BmrU family lipid kinase [Aequorivita todarodis]|uniref:diacylglycerol/lipid kinase family protein n=1 Tax=Aequorivita todarodis TaxID=2036821 RepID=UPI0023506E16|nr:YegS/Rv2252/BmrU family lipid kinase [Aequorivita todarodis]MDC8000504.1 YegS/Rv2252/BmrU family lipid kinase [Aequorivita todarodis]
MKSENYILLVVNPIAGSSEKKTIIDAVKIEAIKQGYQFKLYQTTGKEDEKAIKSIIEDLKPARVIVAGGDGTISLVAQCVFETEIILGIIPAGSANGMAVNFGLPETLEEQIIIAFSDCYMKIDVLFINSQICLHIADLGINAELVKNYETSGVRGKLGYFLQSIPTLINSDSPFHFTIKTGDEIVEVSGILLAIANANKFGTGATINPRGKVNDGKFEVLVFKNLDFIEIFKTMHDQPDMSSDFVQIISTEKASIKSRKKIPFQIDGEYMGEVNEVNVSVAQEKLLMALPEKFCKLHST